MSDPAFEEEFKQKLCQKYAEFKRYLIPKAEYFKIISDLKAADGNSEKKSRSQYYYRQKCEVMKCGDVEKLIKKRNSPEEHPIYYATIEENWDIITRAHVATGHGARDKMDKHLKVTYANITKESLVLYKSYCKTCEQKQSRSRTTGVVVKPIFTNEFNSRGQVDLIDMQSSAQGEFSWLMNYQDHLTKFVVLRPLTSKRAACVAFQLLDIFLLLGAPAILQSDNGSEFTASVIAELKIMFPRLVLVNGRPRHPQSQGSVERANGDVKNMLFAWMADNNTQDWTVGVKFVQFQKNGSHHEGIKQTPYKAMFGEDPKVGLTSSSLPAEILDRLNTEEDLLTLLETRSVDMPPVQPVPISDLIAPVGQPQLPPQPPATPSQQPVTAVENVPPVLSRQEPQLPSQLPATPSQPPAVPSQQPGTVVENVPPVLSRQEPQLPPQPPATPSLLPKMSGEDVTPDETTPSITTLMERSVNIRTQRKRACEAQMNQAEKMVKKSRVILKPGEAGDNVRMPIPQVDRGRCDPKNLMGIILSRDENDLYRIAVKAGILNTKYARNQFDLCAQKLISMSDVNTEDSTSLRQAVRSTASGGQGFFHCDCNKGKSQCQTRRCKCFKAQLLCNSRCHKSMTCKNKN